MCYQFDQTQLKDLKKLIDNGTLRLEWHDLTIFDQPWNSSLGAQAGMAASEQGKFWEFVEVVSRSGLEQHKQGGEAHVKWDLDIAKSFAQKAGVPDLAKFEQDLKSEKFKSEIAADSQKGMQAGFQGTPSFIIKDRALIGAQPIEIFQKIIEAAQKDK